MLLTASQINVSSKGGACIQEKFYEQNWKALLCTKVIFTTWQSLTWSFKKVVFKGKKKCFPTSVQQRTDLQSNAFFFFNWRRQGPNISVKCLSEESFQYMCSVNAINYTAVWPNSFDTESMSIQRVCKWRLAKWRFMTLGSTAVLLAALQQLLVWWSSPSSRQSLAC